MKSDFVEKNSFEVLLSLMCWENSLALRVSLETGLRISDVLALRPSDIDDDCLIHRTASKTGKLSVCELSRRVCEAVRNESNAKWCFPSPRDPNKHRTRQAVWYDIKKRAGQCRMNINVTPHSARKIFAVDEFHEKGLEAVQKRLQHNNLTTTMLYAFSDLLTKEKATRNGEKITAVICNDPKNPNFILYLVEKFCDNLGGVSKVSAALASALNYFFCDDDRGRAAECPQ